MAQFKLNEGFTENDFVVDASVDEGTERHSIFELNIPDKLCLFRTADDTYTTLTLKDEHINALLEALSPIWHNEGDKLQIFAIFNDGEYYCQRLLSKFDFAKKQIVNRKYEFEQMSYEDATEVFKIAKAVCWVRREEQVASLERDLANVTETEYFGENQFAQRVRQRNEFLKMTDYRMLPDYDGEHQTEWQAYRAALRTIPKAEDQFEDRSAWLLYLSEMPFPIDPKRWKGIDEIKDLAYDLTNDSFWSTMTTIFSSAADEMLANQLLEMKSRQAQIDKFGKQIPREVDAIVTKYRLDAKMMDFDFSAYTVQE